MSSSILRPVCLNTDLPNLSNIIERLTERTIQFVFKLLGFAPSCTGRFYKLVLGRFYKLVSMEGRVSISLGCLHASRTVSFCFSFGHVARYAPSRKAKTYGTIAVNTSQANL